MLHGATHSHRIGSAIGLANNFPRTPHFGMLYRPSNQWESSSKWGGREMLIHPWFGWWRWVSSFQWVAILLKEGRCSKHVCINLLLFFTVIGEFIHAIWYVCREGHFFHFWHRFVSQSIPSLIFLFALLLLVQICCCMGQKSKKFLGMNEPSLVHYRFCFCRKPYQRV